MNKQWTEIKNYALGKNYNLSVVFAGDKLIKNLNKKYRKKNKSTTVLSFPLSKKDGEIFLNKNLTKKQDKDYLFIHSLLHLKGFEHGLEMEKKELKIMKKFKL
ncbi:rRNA maturation RNAse YbeY [Patescibacteria group bacterium]|nr:rRNA maturation RNAse YbeY [Patescibacteria group bacterium]